MATQKKFSLLRKILHTIGLSEDRIDELIARIQEWLLDDKSKKEGIVEYPYRLRDDFLSPAELNFYRVLQTAVSAELHTVLHQIETQFINALSPEACKNTVLFITADHGQVVTPPEKKIFIEDHPELQKMLLMRPFGEPRVVYFYVKQGKVETAVDYINTHLSHAMLAWRTDEVLAAGLLGAIPHAPQTAERMGDVIVMMRDDYALLPERPDKNKKKFEFLGRHGGMTHAEMSVPWLGFRLDSLHE